MVNLLPIKNQRTVAWEHRRRILLVVLLFVSSSIVLLALFLSPSLLVVWSAVGGYTQQLTATKTLVDLQRRQSGTEALADLQAKSDLLKDVLSRRTLTSILQDIMPRISEGISLQEITYNNQNEEILVTLKGVARTRAALLSLGDSLRLSPLFSRVDVPVSSLVRSTDIDFTITLLLDSVQDAAEGSGTLSTEGATSSDEGASDTMQTTPQHSNEDSTL